MGETIPFESSFYIQIPCLISQKYGNFVGVAVVSDLSKTMILYAASGFSSLLKCTVRIWQSFRAELRWKKVVRSAFRVPYSSDSQIFDMARAAVSQTSHWTYYESMIYKMNFRLAKLLMYLTIYDKYFRYHNKTSIYRWHMLPSTLRRTEVTALACPIKSLASRRCSCVRTRPWDFVLGTVVKKNLRFL